MAFTKDDQVAILEGTLQAWSECEDAEPIMVQVDRKNKFELIRRIAADNMATGKYYVLADLGCIPASKDIIQQISGRINGASLAELAPDSGVVVCQKGRVKQWLPKSTPTYRVEHADSVRRSGGTVVTWDDISYKLLQEC